MRLLLALSAALLAFLVLRAMAPSADEARKGVAQNPAPIIAALIGVGGALSGVFGGFALWRAQERARAEADARARKRRLAETLEALDATMQLEVRALRSSFEPARSEARLAGYRAQIDAPRAGENSMPAGVAADANILFELTEATLTELPGVVSGALAQFRMLDRQLNKATVALSDGIYRDASTDRKKAALVAYHLLGEQTLATALYAHAAVRDYRAVLTEAETRPEHRRRVTILSPRRQLRPRDRRLLCALTCETLRRTAITLQLGLAERSD